MSDLQHFYILFNHDSVMYKESLIYDSLMLSQYLQRKDLHADCILISNVFEEKIVLAVKIADL